MRKYHMCSGGGVKDNRCVVCCQCVYISAIYMYCSQSFIDIMYRQYSTLANCENELWFSSSIGFSSCIKDSREGKGHRCCLGDRIDSIPCRACYFAPGYLKKLKKGMNSSYSSYRPGEIHPLLYIVLVQFILLFKSPWCKICTSRYHEEVVLKVYSTLTNWDNELVFLLYRFSPSFCLHI